MRIAVPSTSRAATSVAGGTLATPILTNRKEEPHITMSAINTLQVSVDVFNLFNFAAVTQVDQRFTSADVLPVQVDPAKNPQKQLCIAGTDQTCTSPLVGSDGTAVAEKDLNPNYKNPLQYQTPLTVRFGARVTF